MRVGWLVCVTGKSCIKEAVSLAPDQELAMSLLLQSIPPEILSEICSWACIDAGQTGCQLNLVCKAFRELCSTTGVDLQYVSVRQLHKMKIFLEMLEKRSMSGRKVRSLMLAERGRLERKGKPITPGKHEPYIRMPSPLNRVILDIVTVLEVVQKILESISPNHLQSLALYFPFWRFASYVPAIIPVDLPELVELIVSGSHDRRSFSSSRVAPKLSKLHIFTIDHLPPEFGVELARAAPNLQLLNVSNIARIGCGTAEACRDFRDVRVSQLKSSGVERGNAASLQHTMGAPSIFPQSLRQIVLNFMPFYQSSAHLFDLRQYEHMMAISTFDKIVPIPKTVEEVDATASLVVLPVPHPRDQAQWADDEDECFQAFQASWESQMVANSDIAWLGVSSRTML